MSDTRQQAAPGGMRRIPFPLESYEHYSQALSAKRLVNFYAEKEPDDARNALALIPSAGLTTTFEVGLGPILAFQVVEGLGYVVSGEYFYRINPFPTMTVEYLGHVGAAAGRSPIPTIAGGPNAVVVCVPPRAYTTGVFPGDPLNEIGGDYPGASSVAWIDGYFAYTDYTDNAKFFLSRLNDPADFDALDFASADATPNVLRRCVTFRNQLWLIGETALEVWYDAGNADFPLRRMPGGMIPFGCGNERSVAIGDGSLWWVGVDNIVYRSNGISNATRVSTHAIEFLVARFGNLSATNGFFFSELGHSFYAVTLYNPAVPNSVTMLYDCATGLWHYRASSVTGLGAWRPSSAQYWQGTQFFGDSISNRIFTFNLGGGEDGVAVLRQAILPPLWAGTARGFCARLEVEMEVGTPMAAGSVTLDWSDDGGATWGPDRVMSLGPAGARRTRVFTTRLGSFRQRDFRLNTTASPTLYAVDADITAGVH